MAFPCHMPHSEGGTPDISGVVQEFRKLGIPLQSWLPARELESVACNEGILRHEMIFALYLESYSNLAPTLDVIAKRVDAITMQTSSPA
jgi:hypothetical protein